MRLDIHAACDRGLLRRDNEDMVLAAGRFIRDGIFDVELEVRDGDILFFAVADGLGGAPAGEVASETALRFFDAQVGKLAPGLGLGDLRRFFQDLTAHAHGELRRAGDRNPRLRGMGTTLTGFLLYGGEWSWVNIGDSRAYLLGAEGPVRLSRDHSLREATGRPDAPSHILVNCLGGGSPDAYCDFGAVGGLSRTGGALLLSTDGLHDLLGDRRIGSITAENPLNPVPALVAAAKEAGGRDNISCLHLRAA